MDSYPHSPATPGTPTASAAPWKRRLSHPTISLNTPQASPPPSSSYLPLPIGFPSVSVSGLRAALLGYLGEAENAIRERLGMDPVEDEDMYDYEPEGETHRRLSVTSSPSPSSEDETDIDTLGAAAVYGTAAARAGNGNGPESQLRRRHTRARTNIAPTRPRDPHSPSPTPTAEEHAMLDSLRRLREDILAYVPAVPAGLSGFTPNREWLQSLPNRLQAVDLGLTNCLTDLSDAAWPDPVSASSRAMNGARQRVIDIVHSALPPDDWAGWETLGWGNQDKDRRARSHHAKSCSLDEKWARLEDDEDEPEYLFPNRTPGPASAIARRRLKRSKSLGDSDFAFHPPSFLDQWIRPVADVAAVVDDEGEADLGDLDARSVEAALAAAEEDLHAHEIDVPCDKHGVHQVLDDTDVVPSVAEAIARSENGKKLITFNDLPVWWRNNQYILTGYRFIPLDRLAGPIPLIKSAFAMHNETVNIHSHSIPTLFIMCCIPLIVWRSPLPDAHWIDTAMLISYLLAASSCLSSSAGWHILAGCANKRWFEWGACVDYIGISWLIALSFNTVVYNAYYCRPKTVMAFTSVNVAFGALGSYLPFQKWFNQRKNKHWRILFFLTLNCAMFAPLVNIFLEHGYTKGHAFVSPFFRSVGMYVLGLLFYAFHFPECYFPGKFDIWGASHNMWHIGIVLAIILHYNAIFFAFDYRWDYSCAAPDAGTPFPVAVHQFLLG